MEIDYSVREDCLIVSFDSSKIDDTVLVVSRQVTHNDYYNVEVLKTFRSEEAWCMYNKLLGNI